MVSDSRSVSTRKGYARPTRVCESSRGEEEALVKSTISTTYLELDELREHEMAEGVCENEREERGLLSSCQLMRDEERGGERGRNLQISSELISLVRLVLRNIFLS